MRSVLKFRYAGSLTRRLLITLHQRRIEAITGFLRGPSRHPIRRGNVELDKILPRPDAHATV